MKSFLFLCLLGAFSIISFSSSASAQAVQCGTPDDVRVSPGDFEYCDIYQRQLDYREKAMQLREDIEARQENFAAPRKAAKEMYDQDLKDLRAAQDQAKAENNAVE